jgi:hypothetical protein
MEVGCRLKRTPTVCRATTADGGVWPTNRRSREVSVGPSAEYLASMQVGCRLDPRLWNLSLD